MHTHQRRAAPAAWARRTLSVLDLSKHSFSGPLPEEWGRPGAFSKLDYLNLELNPLTGTLPASWCQAGSFDSLTTL